MKKLFKLMSLCICSVLVFSLLTACSGAMEFSGSVLAAGRVGEEYSASVATAEIDGEAGITYALKDGSSLPAGLTLSPDGEITGIPAAKITGKSFTVVARAKRFASTEANFRLTIEEGALAYGEPLPRVAVNKPYSGSLTVTGAGSAVTYTLLQGGMPTGLTFDNGVITGTATVLDEEKTFTVTASAADSAPVTAEFTLKVILPWLEYNSFEIEKARQGVEYGETVASAKAETDGVAISYALKSGASLPLGLSINSEGYISGTPTQAGPAISFIIVAAAAGYSSTEAAFSIVVRKPIVVEGEGTIIYNAIPLEPGYLNETYHITSVDIRKGSASNLATVTYALKEGSTMPKGLVLQSGRIRPNAKLTELGEHSFIIVASAEACPDVEVTFTFIVLPERLVYNSFTLGLATVGTAFSASAATAEKPNGGGNTGIRYALKTGTKMPAGLELNPDGAVSGTPEKSYKLAFFTVVASADAYSPREAEIYIPIRDAVTVVRDGIFEAEYMDLTGISGGGYSGSASEENMIQAGSSYNASNGYYVGFTHSELSLSYKITSSAAVSNATLRIGLNSEIGSINLTPSSFAILVNGVSVPYGSLSVSGATGSTSVFQDLLVTSGLTLTAGENIIILQVKNNLLMGGTRTGGPGIDYIKIERTGSAVLSWVPAKYNLSRFE